MEWSAGGAHAYEFAILQVLVERKGQVVQREQILDLAKRGAENAFERSIDVRRRKLGGDREGSSSIIRTVRGEGYVLAWDNDALTKPSPET